MSHRPRRPLSRARARVVVPLVAAAVVLPMAGPVVAEPTPASTTGPLVSTTDDGRAMKPFETQPPTQAFGPYVYPDDMVVAPSGRRGYALDENRMTVFDITRRPIRIVARANTVFGTDMVVMPGSKIAYVVNDQTLIVVNVAKARPRVVRRIRTATPQDVLAMALGNGGKHLYLTYGSGFPSGLGQGVRVMGLAKPKRPSPISRFDTASLPAGVAVSRDGNRVVTANNLVGSVTVANVANPRRPKVIRKELDLPFDVASVATYGDLAYAYGGDDARIAVIGLGKGVIRRIKNFKPGNDGGSDIAITGDGRFVVALQDQQPPQAVISILDRRTLSPVQRFKGVSFPEAVAISKNGPTGGDMFVAVPGFLGDPGNVYPFDRRR